MDFPQVPNTHALVMLLMTGVALFLFSREKIHLESSSLAILVMVVVGFQLFPFEGARGSIEPMTFFYGFGHEALIAVCALMIAGEALVRTGSSAFMNNTPIVVLMLPMLIGAVARSKGSASGVLLPMGFATLLGGMGTTIGTSTNLLVVSVAADMGMERFAMFDFMIPVAIAASVAIIYLWLVAPHMIPKRTPPMADLSNREFEAHLLIPPGNPLVGRSLAHLIHKAGEGFRVKRIFRDEHQFISSPVAHH